MQNRGGYNRRTGKSTPRHKAKTHWGAKRSVGRAAASKKAGKPAAASPAKK